MVLLLIVRQELRETLMTSHRQLLAIVRNDAAYRRLMTIPRVDENAAL
jgi:hypothetical protein